MTTPSLVSEDKSGEASRRSSSNRLQRYRVRLCRLDSRLKLPGMERGLWHCELGFELQHEVVEVVMYPTGFVE